MNLPWLRAVQNTRLTAVRPHTQQQKLIRQLAWIRKGPLIAEARGHLHSYHITHSSYVPEAHHHQRGLFHLS